MKLKGIRAITVCVNYHDILAVTLPRSLQTFDAVTVVTHPSDQRTIDVAQRCGADLFSTEVFYDRGAVFNKFAALEQGLDHMGRNGFLCVMDADIVFPVRDRQWSPKSGFLHTPRRRMVLKPTAQIPGDNQWKRYRYPMANEEFAGYCQIFDSQDPALGDAPWHDINWTWAGSGDSFFHMKWPDNRKTRPPFEVLHLGEAFQNWAGRVSPYLDGTIDEQAHSRARQRESLMGRRSGKRGLDRYSAEKLK